MKHFSYDAVTVGEDYPIVKQFEKFYGGTTTLVVSYDNQVMLS